jgi:hypothetical protein
MPERIWGTLPSSFTGGTVRGQVTPARATTTPDDPEIIVTMGYSN